MNARLLPGLRRVESARDGVRINAFVGGEGPPILLLHGYPQTSAMWHRVAPELIAAGHTVVLADLRGYGDSDKPGDTPSHDPYGKRAMAADQVSLMKSLGFARFAVVGHDRGARVAHRMALDSPERVRSVAVLDIVPTLHMFESVDRAMASEYFHWFFLAQSSDLPERLILADTRAWLRSRFAGRNAGGRDIDEAAMAEYERCFDPATVRASCADYRAAAGVDLVHDRRDRERGRLIEAPLLALWGAGSYVGRNFDVARVWKSYARRVDAVSVHADHYLCEEAPDAVAHALTSFCRNVESGEPR
ncbi:alpha/beta hydrolase (plasmid) [Embleya sp. NBC_00888]|uniref:alpha/beta fold hydrolase n=1 Tax=Embleya sp. NBC_00888 TaxID=2975960 RepID=UPI002F90F2B0|nr:alpha/beta hydrolase [Embleya sp. NBC_00888]